MPVGDAGLVCGML